ncbi:MAG: peptidoglycan DD-metalloendopeptidase family protein [Xanthomonadales bacterium]|nr:peptidoglycan DD-metalloendopeptidase family protein [Xanthomonadales bacterium]
MERHFLTSGHSLVLTAALVLGACASTGPAPVDDLSHGAPARQAVAPATAAAGGMHRVARGDTLYSIAFRNGLDYRDLAQWNGIGAPYTIYVGQELRLGPGARGAARTDAVAAAAPMPAPPSSPSVSTRAAAPAAVAATPTPPPFENVEPGSATAAKPLAPAPPSQVPAATAAATLEATAPQPATPAPAAAPTPPPVSAEPLAAPAPAPAESLVVGEVGWRWPADGRVVGNYVAGDRTRQGIDISGRAGDPVRAAANGSVVYSGNGLIGYGELIIIKHSPSFLSAYGHNRKRLVKEGDRVAAGQVIAEMGTGSAGRDALHFEIRRNGKPENPLVFLPRR